MEFLQLDTDNREEIGAVIEIEKEAFGKNGGVDEWVLKPLARYGRVFVVKDAGDIKCVAEFIQKFGENKVYLYGIATKKNSRKKGYARYLMNESFEYFRGMGMEELCLTVGPENRKAINFYENLGFEKKKSLKNEYGIGEDRIYMVKKIN